MIIVPAAFLAAAAAFKSHPKELSVSSTFIGLILAVYFFLSVMTSGSIAQSYNYIPALNIGFSLNAGSTSMILLLMASIVLFVTAFAGNVNREKERTASLLLLLFQAGVSGLFLSGNFFVFFIFWDIGIIAPFFMINILGSANRRIASYKFILYEIFASALLLAGIILIYFYAPAHTLNIYSLSSLYAQMPLYIQETIFILFFIAFMINIPVFPLHTWLPDAHSEASTQGSMVLSGIVTKFGGFGMILIFATMPVARSFSYYIAILAAFSAFYAAFLTMRQSDLKRVVAHTTIVEMSIVLFAIATMTNIGQSGAVFGMLSHGLVVALMFLSVGAIEHIFHERKIDMLRGISKGAKFTAYAFLVGIFIMTGVPLTSGFIADVLIFIGGASAFGIYGIIPLFSLIILGAFMYLVINKSFFANRRATPAAATIGISQKMGYAVLLAAIFFFGILPFVALNLINSGGVV
ncbi:NADH-quinone oxidoreductase subunit M [Candidatus Marsarchaeota archaeon]|nr:NADH-quinone oxidoreductase subunit M [Candidatus Marsarchaeota archaeon]